MVHAGVRKLIASECPLRVESRHSGECLLWVESGHCHGLLPSGPFRSSGRVEFVSDLITLAIVTTPIMLWARWSKLDLGFRAPDLKAAEPWVLLYILWITAERAISIFLPFEADPEWLARMEQISLVESLFESVVLAPMVEELLFRGAMFAALLRRWGIWSAALVPSLIWGLLHVQYEWWVVGLIAGSGILLAMVRWKSGSLYLPIVFHAASNLLATLNNHGVFTGAA